jgi:hypothetical protein
MSNCWSIATYIILIAIVMLFIFLYKYTKKAIKKDEDELFNLQNILFKGQGLEIVNIKDNVLEIKFKSEEDKSKLSKYITKYKVNEKGNFIISINFLFFEEIARTYDYCKKNGLILK